MYRNIVYTNWLTKSIQMEMPIQQKVNFKSLRGCQFREEEGDHGGTEDDPEPHWRDGLQGFSPSKAASEEEEWVWN